MLKNSKKKYYIGKKLSKLLIKSSKFGLRYKEVGRD
jgi:hypothetical protein